MITIHDIVDLLNSLIALDRTAIETLINQRVACNDLLAAHPTVQVGMDEQGGNIVGMLGVLNGLFPVDATGYGQLVAVYNENRRLIRFEVNTQWVVRETR